MKIEYRVRPVTRYVVTHWYEHVPSEDENGKVWPGPTGVETKGEFDNPDTAYAVAYALCKAEHDRLGYPPGDERVQYPKRLLHHSSDCAVYNEPAYPAGPCDCGHE